MKISKDKKYKTREGHPVRILCTDAKIDDYPVVGLILEVNSESLQCWTETGQYWSSDEVYHVNDLIEVSEWGDFWIDEPVMVRDFDEERWFRRHFAGIDPESGKPLAWTGAYTSFTVQEDGPTIKKTAWNQCRRPTNEEFDVDGGINRQRIKEWTK